MSTSRGVDDGPAVQQLFRWKKWLTERERGRCVPRRLWRMVGEIGGSRNGGTGAARRKKCDPHGTAIPKKPPGTNGTHGHQQAGVVHQLLQFDAVDGWANGCLVG
uniref:Uncharacterized protein n=1 Tax=Oryza meridionalis TaxID=40149 RepID=A0A0E0CSB6_9ORYZ